MNDESVLKVLLIYYHSKSMTRGETLFLIESYFSQHSISEIIEQLIESGKTCLKNKLNNSSLFFIFGIQLFEAYVSNDNSVINISIIKLRYYLSKYYIHKKSYEKAKEILESIYSEIKIIEQIDELISFKIIDKLSHVYFYLKDFSGSEEKFFELIDAIKNKNFDNDKTNKYLSNAFNVIGVISFYRRNFIDCISLQLMSIDYQQKCSTNDNSLLYETSLVIADSSTLSETPNYEFALFWFEKALAFYNKLLAFGDKRADKLSLFQLNQDIGICYYNTNKFETAINWFDKNLIQIPSEKFRDIVETCQRHKDLCLKHIKHDYKLDQNSSISSNEPHLFEDLYKVCPDLLLIINKYYSKQSTSIDTLKEVKSSLKIEEIDVIASKLKMFGTILFYKYQLEKASLLFKYAIELLENEHNYDYINIYRLKIHFLSCFQDFFQVHKEEMIKYEKFCEVLSEILVNWDENEKGFLVDRYEILSKVYIQLGKINDRKKDHKLAHDFCVKSYDCCLKCSKVNKYDIYSVAKRIAQLLRYANDYKPAYDWYLIAMDNLISLSYRHKYLKQISELNYEIGYFVLSYLQDHKNAIKWFEKNINSQEFDNFKIVIEKSKLFYGVCIFHLNQFNNAIKYIEAGSKYFQISEGLSMPEKATILRYLGICQQVLGQFENAATSFIQSNDNFNQIDDKTNLEASLQADNCYRLGLCLGKLIFQVKNN
jgi:tetratricopeptide (TPR) repeat protein